MKQKIVFIGLVSLLIISISYFYNPEVFGMPCNNTLNGKDISLCGHGTMTAIIVTSHDPELESKFAAYNEKFGLTACTVENGCLEIIAPYGESNSIPSMNLDMLPFVEQAHQASPGSKILIVEAKSISWQDKYDAANYAKSLPEVEKVFSTTYSKVVMMIGLVLK